MPSSPDSVPRDAFLAELRRASLLDLTTMRADRTGVTTPVRFAVDADRIVVSLDATSHKVRRAHADPRVVVARHGSPDAAAGTLRFLEGGEAAVAYRVLGRRYRLLFLQRLLLGRRPTQHLTCEVTLD